MADSRDVIVRFIGEDRDLQRAFTNTEKSSKRVEGRFSTLNKSLRGGIFGSGTGARSAFLFGSSAFIGTAGITAAISKSIDAASDLNEEITKSRQVFGDASTAVDIWSKTTARSIGVSRLEALKATGTFGNLFNTVGLLPEKSADMSRALTQLAADLASFNNADISDVLLAIRSGLIGEAEPLRRYGVLLSETRVQQAAMAATGKSNVKELTNQEKALARYNIILEDTVTAQGDFERTSGGMANQTRIMKAQFADLSAELGGNLLPIVNKSIEGINDLFDAFSQAGDKFKPIEGLGDSIENIDVSQLIAVRDRLREIGDDGDRDIEILSRLIDLLQQTGPSRPDDRGGPRGVGAIAASNRRVDAAKADREAAEAKRDLENSRKRFSTLTKGLGLKLDKAEITATLDDDLAVLQEIERAIQRQIQREGKTFELVSDLTQVRAQIATTSARRASDAAQKSSEAFDAVFDSLDLDVERARDTPQLNDDLRALRIVEQRIKARMAAEGRTLELQRRLLDVQREINDVLRQQAEAREERARREQEAQQGRQFRALGLTAEGEERTPTSRQLRRRSLALEDRIKGTVLDTEKTRAQLDRIQKVLSGKFGKVGKEIRQAILQMLDDIAGAFKEGDKKVSDSAEITAGGMKSLKQLTEGLGLTQDQLEEMGRRQMGVDRRDRSSAFGFAVKPARTSTTGGGREPEITIHNHIVIDGKDVATSVNRVNQKNGRRRSSSRSGRAGGRPAGI